MRRIVEHLGSAHDEAGLDVKPRVLWRLVYLVPVVAGCDCSWRWWSWLVSGAQAASCSAGVRIPMAEWRASLFNGLCKPLWKD